MWTDSRVIDLLGVAHPILQAPMAGTTNPTLVAAVSNAGALGGHGAGGSSPEELRSSIREIRALTPGPFNVNLFYRQSTGRPSDLRVGPRLAERLSRYHSELGLGPPPEPVSTVASMDEQLGVLIDEGVDVISFHFGVEAETVSRAQTGGAKVLCTATTLSEALRLEEAGVDAIIAQGSEAGGHRGTFEGRFQRALIGTMALVPRIVDEASVPVIAAGGIMDARGLVACLALGASAVQRARPSWVAPRRTSRRYGGSPGDGGGGRHDRSPKHSREKAARGLTIATSRS